LKSAWNKYGYFNVTGSTMPIFVIKIVFEIVIEIVIEIYMKLECGPVPNVMVALPNICGALCSTPQSLADAHYLTAVQ